MQLRHNDHTQASRPSLDVRPGFVLKEQRFEEWCAAGEAGRKKLAKALDQAVIEIVEKYQIVERAFAADLRKWLPICIDGYYADKTRQDARVTEEQARDRWARIETAGQILLKEIPVHCGLRSGGFADWSYSRDPSFLRMRVEEHLAELKEILDHAKFISEVQRPMRKRRARNAAKPALAGLGRHIRRAWMTGWGTARMATFSDLTDPHYRSPIIQVPVVAAGSKYVQFATYMYAFLDQTCTERMIIKRLKAAENS